MDGSSLAYLVEEAIPFPGLILFYTRMTFQMSR